MIKMKLHVKLAEKRLTQKQFSEDTKIRLATVNAYCTDNFKTISKEHIDIICKYFKCNIEDIIEYVEED